MKKTVKIVLLAILGFVLAVLLAFAIWQRDNIKVLYHSLTSDSETAAQNLQRVVAEHKKQLEEEYQVYVPQPTREQTDALLTGAQTQQEVMEELGIDQIASSNPTDAKGIAEKYTAQLYSYRVELMTKLGVIADDLLSQWRSLPAAERTSDRKSALITDGVHRCYTLEAESDAHVKQVLSQLEQELKTIGADTSVTKVLWQQYVSEKSAEKTYYFNKYLW